MATTDGRQRELTIVMFTNLLIHHLVMVADNLYAAPGVRFFFIAEEGTTEWMIRTGYPDYSTRPYLVCLANGEAEKTKAAELIAAADVVVTASNWHPWIHQRVQRRQLTFVMSEHWFKESKRRIMLHPLFWRNLYRNYLRFRRKPYYFLCMSGYAAQEANMVGAFKGKCYKWGYFPLASDIDIENVLASKCKEEPFRILWVSRMLGWKHPELAVRLALRLKDEGRNFVIDMYGSGELTEATASLIRQLGVDDYVRMPGNLPNERLLKEFASHHTFILTSDHNEGWGAVVNEAMSNGCTVVAAGGVGSVPYLIDNGKTGMVFRDRNLDDLHRCVAFLMDNPEECENMARAAYEKISGMWSPGHASEALLTLSRSLLAGHPEPLREGPCSLA